MQPLLTAETLHRKPLATWLARWFGLAFAALWLVACSESPEEQIVGKWRVANSTDGNVLEFYQDGTVTFFESITGLSVNGEYAFLNDEKIKVELSGILAITGATIYTVVFSDDRMTLKPQNGGNVSTYDRLE